MDANYACILTAFTFSRPASRNDIVSDAWLDTPSYLTPCASVSRRRDRRTRTRAALAR